MLNKLLLTCILIYIPQSQNSVTAKVVKPIMPAVPLNPREFEKAIRMKIDKVWANDRTYDDGTTHDIIPSKENNNMRAGSGDAGYGIIGTPWTNGIIPYILDEKFTESDRINISKALLFITDFTCIQITPRTNEANYVVIQKNPGKDCASAVGMNGGAQKMELAPRCIKRIGSTAHEFMHALGFEHEQNRYDRDDYVRVIYENIAHGYERSFGKTERTQVFANYESIYDYKSIIHYTNTADSANGMKTLEALKDPRMKLGQREKLTQLDIQKINLYYNCGSGKSSGDDVTETNNRTENTRIGVDILGAIICQDFDSDSCDQWSAHGHCRRSPIYMAVFCKRTCGKCGMGCVDMNKNCSIWAERKYCKKYYYYMKHFCPKACNRC